MNKLLNISLCIIPHCYVCVFLYPVALSFLYHGVVYTKRDNSHKETLWLDTLHVGSCADLEGDGGGEWDYLESLNC